MEYLSYINSSCMFHPRFCDTPSREHYCMMQYIHYTIRYLPRFIDIDISVRC
jgi:hypothetical protein